MKKIVLTVMAMLTMTLAHAEENVTTLTAEAKTYDMSVNYRRLAVCLGLDLEQMDAVEMIHDHFCNDMMQAAAAPKDEQRDMLDKAVKRDLRYMHYVLDRKQFRKYQQLLNVTLRNRGLIEQH